MLKTIYCYTLGWLYLIITYPYLLWVKNLGKRNKIQVMDYKVYKFTRRLCKFLFRITGSTLKVSGMENVPKNQPVLFVSNHESHADSTIIHGYIDVPKGFVSIVEVLKFPIFRSWMKLMKCVFLDRGDIKQTFTCIEEGVNFLKQGHSMVIFPEGKLSDDDTVGEFKKGCLRLAVKAGVPIIPITLKGSYRIMKKDGSYIRAAAVECIISKPIPTAGLGKDDEKKLVDTVREIIINSI